MKVRLKPLGITTRVSPSASARCHPQTCPFFALERWWRCKAKGGLVLIDFLPLVPGETARRIGRLDEAPRVYQGKRCGGFGVRKPVGVGIPSVVFSNALSRVSDSVPRIGVVLACPYPLLLASFSLRGSDLIADHFVGIPSGCSTWWLRVQCSVKGAFGRHSLL